MIRFCTKNLQFLISAIQWRILYLPEASAAAAASSALGPLCENAPSAALLLLAPYRASLRAAHTLSTSSSVKDDPMNRQHGPGKTHKKI